MCVDLRLNRQPVIGHKSLPIKNQEQKNLRHLSNPNEHFPFQTSTDIRKAVRVCGNDLADRW